MLSRRLFERKVIHLYAYLWKGMYVPYKEIAETLPELQTVCRKSKSESQLKVEKKVRVMYNLVFWHHHLLRECKR